ncbi:hypothetical protein ACJX0J_028710, partial [Zea mays]
GQIHVKNIDDLYLYLYMHILHLYLSQTCQSLDSIADKHVELHYFSFITTSGLNFTLIFVAQI